MQAEEFFDYSVIPHMKAISYIWLFWFPSFESLFQFKLGAVLKVGRSKGTTHRHSEVS